MLARRNGAVAEGFFYEFAGLVIFAVVTVKLMGTSAVLALGWASKTS